MKNYVCAAAITICLASAFSTLRAQSALPSGWPARLELGMADAPGGAAAMKATAPFAFRYQYLAGGVNTGSGWATWNTNGEFARYYIEDSLPTGSFPSSPTTRCSSRCRVADPRATRSTTTSTTSPR